MARRRPSSGGGAAALAKYFLLVWAVALGALVVLHERSITVHAPPSVLYSHTASFRFPEVTASSLAGDEVTLGARSLFAGQWTLVGCLGSKFAQDMVDGWLTGVADAARASGGGATTADATTADATTAEASDLIQARARSRSKADGP